jgi:hypothetical protein
MTYHPIVDIHPRLRQTLGPEMHGDNKYWGGGVLAPNGVMYFPSPFSDKVLSIIV